MGICLLLPGLPAKPPHMHCSPGGAGGHPTPCSVEHRCPSRPGAARAWLRPSSVLHSGPVASFSNLPRTPPEVPQLPGSPQHPENGVPGFSLWLTDELMVSIPSAIRVHGNSRWQPSHLPAPQGTKTTAPPPGPPASPEITGEGGAQTPRQSSRRLGRGRGTGGRSRLRWEQRGRRGNYRDG